MPLRKHLILLAILLSGVLPGKICSQSLPSAVDCKQTKVYEKEAFGLKNIETLMDKGAVTEISNLKRSIPLALSPMIPFGAMGVSTEGLGLGDVQYVGWKAAHVGILRTALPQHSPKTLALTFDLWNAFLDQALTGEGSPDVTTERTLCEEIALRLGPYQSYPPPDRDALFQELTRVRDLFTDGISVPFSATLKNQILTALTDPAVGFDPNTMLCFRCSPNIDDNADFVDADPYQIYRGCLTGSLDGSAQDVCGCHPKSGVPCTVFQAIRETYASFYSNHAFLERRRHSLEESKVGTALLVYPCLPAAREIAHGVASVDRGITGLNTFIKLVSQVGAASRTHSQDDAIAEEVIVQQDVSGMIMPPQLECASSLVPLGSHVMNWKEDYEALAGLLLSVSDQYGLQTGKTNYILALTYKKISHGDPTVPVDGLRVIQVCEGAVPDDTLVTILDPHLKARVEETLGIPEPTVSDMLGLTDLLCSRMGIVDVTGLEWAKNLQTLVLSNCLVSHVESLRSLHNIETLNISNNRIKDLSPLSGLWLLRHLNVHENGIQDLSPLAGLHQMESLIVRENPFTDISPLANLVSLRHLDLSEGGELTDISALGGLRKLEILSLSVNHICDISALAHLELLRELELRTNSIQSLRPLTRLVHLQRLDLRYNPGLPNEAYCDHLYKIVQKNPGIVLNYTPNTNRPRGVSASRGTYADRIIVTWDDVPQGPLYPSYYQITRMDSAGNSTLLNNAWQTATTFTDTTALPGETYTYRIQGAADDQGIFRTETSVAVTGWRQ